MSLDSICETNCVCNKRNLGRLARGGSFSLKLASLGRAFLINYVGSIGPSFSAIPYASSYDLPLVLQRAIGAYSAM